VVLKLPRESVISTLVSIDLPDHLLGELRPRDLMIDLAVGMYAARHLTLGQAAELAGLSQIEMQRELGRREIPAHYDLDDLAYDLAAAAELSRR
jgi:predicted HTH domain antitoxin